MHRYGGPVGLVERETELHSFDRLFAETLHGRGAILVVDAPVGAGKTALLQAMTDSAARQGGACVVVAAAAAERQHPLGLMDRLVRSLRAAGMDDPFPGGELDGRRRQEWPYDDFFAVMERAFGVIRDFADGRRVVISIDDVHFADDQSLCCLAFLIRRAEWSGLLMILGESSSHERELAALHAEMLHLSCCHRVRLAPLTVSGVAGVLSDRLGAPPDGETVRFSAQASGGNPLLLHALIDDLRAGPGEPAEPRASFRQAVLRSLYRSPPVTVAVARSLAVLGVSATPPLIAEFLGVDVAPVREAILELRAMGLLSAEPRAPGRAGSPAVAAGEFRHDHTRLAVLAGTPPPDLPEMHGKAAELLHERGAPAVAVADQLMATHDSDKAAWRVAILCEAAREAMALGDVAGAVNRLRHAVGLSAGEAQRARVGVLLADAEWHLDPGKAARRLSDLGQDARAGLLTGGDTMILVNQLLWWGEFAEADSLLKAAGADDTGRTAPEDGDTSLARLWAIFCRAGVAGQDAGAAPRSGWAWSGPMVAVTYLGSAASLAYDGTQAGGAEHTLRGIRAGISLTPALYALVLLVQTGRLDEAARWSDRLLAEDWIRRVPMRRVMIEMIKAVGALRRGDSAEALRSVRSVLHAVPPSTWGVVVGLPLSLAVRATTDLGDFVTARSFLNFPVPSAMFDTPFALPYLQALGRYHLTMGYPRTALTHFQSCVELMAAWRLDPADVTDAAGSHNETAAALRAMGMIRPMRPLAAEPRPGPDRANEPWPDTDFDGWPSAGTADGGDPGPARGRRPRSAVADRTPRPPAPPEPPDAAMTPGESAVPEAPGAPAADAAEAAPGCDQLTYAERRVATLASAGNTNRQIAETLFITVSTVEQHLTKIYRKLDVQSRSGLAAALRRYRR